MKVLDFGLAKALEPATARRPTSSQSPTITRPHDTQLGVILGTAAYMAPEQARGQPVDKRARHLGVRLRALRDADRPPRVRGRRRHRHRWRRSRRRARLDALPADARRAPRLLRRCLEKDAAGGLRTSPTRASSSTRRTQSRLEERRFRRVGQAQPALRRPVWAYPPVRRWPPQSSLWHGFRNWFATRTRTRAAAPRIALCYDHPAVAPRR